MTDTCRSLVPPKARGKRGKESIKPISGLDIDSLLGEKKGGKISANNAVPDFKQALFSSEEVSDIEKASKEMAQIVRVMITDSFGDAKYAQAVEIIGVMREELSNLEEPDIYNSFIQDLKKALLSGVLGGDRRDFWFKLRWSKMGLVDSKESEVSDVSPEQSEEVSRSRWNCHYR